MTLVLGPPHPLGLTSSIGGGGLQPRDDGRDEGTGELGAQVWEESCRTCIPGWSLGTSQKCRFSGPHPALLHPQLQGQAQALHREVPSRDADADGLGAPLA